MKRILALATIAFIIGINIAYYNTAGLVYDKVNIISFNSESISIYEHNIDYKDIEETVENIKNCFPKDNITI